MPINLRIAVFLIALVLMIIVIYVLKRNLIPVKYSLLWWTGIFVLFFLSFFPDILVIIAEKMGFQTISNLISGVLFVILIFITICLTVIVSNQKKRISSLTQEISIIKAQQNRRCEQSHMKQY